MNNYTSDFRPGELDVIVSRLKDYELENPRVTRDRLVKKWKEAHPEAVAEAPSCFHILIKSDEWRKPHPDAPDEYWFNDIYTVSVRRHAKDFVFGTKGGMVQIGIASLDGTARHDWRDMQAIKNQIAGEETEAFELYPAESRLVDPSNYYSLWCFPGLKRIKVGLDEGRRVINDDKALAPQRRFEVLNVK